MHKHSILVVDMEEKKPPPLYKRLRLILPLIVILLIVGVSALIVRNLKEPSVGTINQTPASKAEVVDPYANPRNYSGQYVSFTIPAKYKTIPAQKTGKYLEVADFYGSDASGKSIAIGVLKEPITDDTGIKLRRSQPDKYKEQPRNQSGTVMFVGSSSGSEITAFVPHQDKVASISITAPTGWDLNEDMQTVLDSLKWK